MSLGVLFVPGATGARDHSNICADIRCLWDIISGAGTGRSEIGTRRGSARHPLQFASVYGSARGLDTSRSDRMCDAECAC